MYKIVLLTILVTILTANNPRAFSALGDIIYNNVDKINALQKIPLYKPYINDINAYVKDVKETEKEGFALDMGEKGADRLEYLKRLRKLAPQNDAYVRGVYNNYKISMQKNNFKLFSAMINSGLMDSAKHKNEIIDYYYMHKDDINASGVIEKFLEEDAHLKALKEAQRKRYKSKKELEREKIERIRRYDKKRREALEKKLEKELEKKKIEIRENQKKELAS